MPDSGRSVEEIRRQISEEREQLTGALADLREDVRAARRIPMIVGGALAAGLASLAALKVARKLGSD